MKLTGIECVKCKTYFFTKVESGEHKCPECECKNEFFLFDEDLSDKEVEMIQNTFNDIKELISSYGIEFSNTEIMNFVIKIFKKIKEVK